MYGNLTTCAEDCLNWQETLLKFGTNTEDIEFLLNPKMKEWTSLYSKLIRFFKQNPEKLILVMHCYAGHGMSKEGRQVLLINEYSGQNKFYKSVAAEI